MKKAKKILYQLHLWLGIASGLIVFIVCLTGCIYVFKPDIEIMMFSERFFVKPQVGVTKMPIDDLIDMLETKYGKRVTRVSVFDQSNRTSIMALSDSGTKKGQSGGAQKGPGNAGGHGNRDETTVYVDPYTGTICGEGNLPTQGFFRSIMLLHRYLWLPTNIGRPIVGWATMIFVVTLCSGLFLWIPTAWRSLKSWKMGFLIRFRKGPKRLLLDCHNTLGFYMFIPMLLLALTGLCWSFGWYRETATSILGNKVFGERGRQPVQLEPFTNKNDGGTMPFSEILAKTNDLKPGKGNVTLSIPAPDSDSAVVVQKNGCGFWAFTVPDRFEWDPNRGEAILVEHFAEKSFGAKCVAMIRPIHVGDTLGLGWRIIFFIGCLVATSLPVTGVWLWINKLRGRTKKSIPDAEIP